MRAQTPNERLSTSVDLGTCYTTRKKRGNGESGRRKDQEKRRKKRTVLCTQKWTRSTQSLLIFPLFSSRPSSIALLVDTSNTFVWGPNPTQSNQPTSQTGMTKQGFKTAASTYTTTASPPPLSLSHLPISLSAIFHPWVSSAPRSSRSLPQTGRGEKKKTGENRKEL